jgi:hypothetical protein
MYPILFEWTLTLLFSVAFTFYWNKELLWKLSCAPLGS